MVHRILRGTDKKMKKFSAALLLLLVLNLQPVRSDESLPSLGNELIFPNGWELSSFAIQSSFNQFWKRDDLKQVFICSRSDDGVTFYRYCKPEVIIK